jgi:ketosteroid isomerase-like protein
MGSLRVPCQKEATMTTATAATHLTDQDLAQLRALTEDWVQLSLAKDWGGVVALLTDDVVFLPPDHPIVEGKSAALAYLEAYPPIIAFTASVRYAEGHGDLAWGHGDFNMTVEPAPNQTMTATGKWSAVYRKRADGAWLVASDTWNLDAPGTMT